jgi:hypothetical protein
MTKRVIDPVSPKTSEEALDFVRKMQEAFPKTENEFSARPWRVYCGPGSFITSWSRIG